MTRPAINIEDAALKIVRRLREAGHQALFAGGSVRDMLLGIPPTDIDVATDAHPERLANVHRESDLDANAASHAHRGLDS